jgi:AcrR family transcriptional regulator
MRSRPVGQITIDQLATGAGISRSSFYFYFESKAAVLEALLSEIVEEMSEAAGRWLPGAGDDADMLRHAMQVTAELWRSHGPVLQRALLADDPEFAHFRDRIVAGYISQIGARIKRDRAAGLARPGPDARRLADALFRMTCAVYANDPSDVSVETLVVVIRRAIYGTPA